MADKKKVLFLLEAFDKGGIEKVTLDIVNNLDPNKYDITVQTFWYGGYCQSLVKDHVRVIPFFFKHYVRGIIRLIDHLSPKMLYKLFIKERYDVEIAASDGGAAKVISGSSNPDSKKICWVHMDVVNCGSKLQEFQEKPSAQAIYCKFDRIVCVSNEARQRFHEKFGLEERTVTVHNPLPDARIRELSLSVPDIFPNTGTFNIVSVGRFTKEKGFDRLIRVCGRLAQEDKLPVMLYLIGDGPLKSDMEALIHDHGFSNVKMLGFQENPYPYIRLADLYVCPSYSEAFPLVIGESFILQTPVLGTRCSGVCEWLENDGSGYITDNSEKGLYLGLKKVLSAPSLYAQLKERSVLKSKTIRFSEALAGWESEFFSERKHSNDQ